MPVGNREGGCVMRSPAQAQEPSFMLTVAMPPLQRSGFGMGGQEVLKKTLFFATPFPSIDCGAVKLDHHHPKFVIKRLFCEFLAS